MSGTADFHTEMDRLQAHLPDWIAGPMGSARKPYAVWFRAPLALLLIAGGIVGTFLPDPRFLDGAARARLDRH